MQVTIGETIAEVSDDGRDIQFPAPAVAGRALVLPFREPSRPAKPSPVSSIVASTTKSDAAAPAFDLDGRGGAGLVFCAVVAAIAVKRFVGRPSGGGSQASSRLLEDLDDAAFLKRYARTQ